MFSLLFIGTRIGLLLCAWIIAFAQSARWAKGGWLLLEVNAFLQIAFGCLGFASDPLGATMVLLVALLAAVIGRFSKNYLANDPAQGRLLRWLAGVWFCVIALITTKDLVTLSLAWTGTSLCLHKLILLYPERPAARVAANSKFALARLADLGMMGSVFLLYRDLGTLNFLELSLKLGQLHELTPGLQGAACLLALVAILKSGQLPFHGWLVQVMEAPTPVSALLHAGVVNIAGFVLLRMAPLLSLSEPAQMILVAWGGCTAILAGLVTLTRSSIKARLAWSTSAQMGFMLLECGLGAYSLALLHLLAHSLYKAYRFLSAGEAVAAQRCREMAPPHAPAKAIQWLGAVALMVPFLFLFPAEGAWIIGMLPLWVRAVRDVRLFGAGLFVATAFGVQRHLLEKVVASSSPCLGAQGIAAALLALLILLFVDLQLWPRGWLANWLYPRCLAGFSLDSCFAGFGRAREDRNR